MSGRPLRVFLSHTAELGRHNPSGDYVLAATDAISRAGHVPVRMEYFPAHAHTPADLCQLKIAYCDFYIGLIGHRYGSLVPDVVPVQSYMEMEFETATRLRLPRLAFLLREEAARPARGSTDPLDCERQAAFRSKLYEQVPSLTVDTFSTPDELGMLVYQALSEAVGSAAVVRATPDQAWRAGEELGLGGDRYLLQEPIVEEFAPDRSWVWRQARARQLAPASRAVWLRQFRSRPGARDGWQRHDALLAQWRLLGELGAVDGFPLPLAPYDDADGIVVAHSLPEATTLRQTFGPAARPLDGARASLLLKRALGPLCTMLQQLHRRGQSHRALTPDAILVTSSGSRAVLRDLGLVAVTPGPGEGPDPYRAPEQERWVDRTESPGPRTDVFQLAAILYHILTGRQPSSTPPPAPPSIYGTSLASSVDDVLLRALAPAPGDRPKNAAAFCDQLSAALRSRPSSRPR